MFEEPRRARRIRQTRQIAYRRRSDRLNRWFWGEVPEDFDVWAVGFFAKTKGLGCQKCSSRRSGRPKISGGMCKYGVRHRIYVLRRAARKVRGLSRRFNVDWEADDVSLVCPQKNTWE
jgi:hypothetical protein